MRSLLITQRTANCFFFHICVSRPCRIASVQTAVLITPVTLRFWSRIATKLQLIQISSYAFRNNVCQREAPTSFSSKSSLLPTENYRQAILLIQVYKHHLLSSSAHSSTFNKCQTAVFFRYEFIDISWNDASINGLQDNSNKSDALTRACLFHRPVFLHTVSRRGQKTINLHLHVVKHVLINHRRMKGLDVV